MTDNPPTNHNKATDAISTLFDAIKHGDDEHQAWLKEAIDAFYAGQPVPEPRGQGRKEARIAELEAALAKPVTEANGWRDIEDAPHAEEVLLYIPAAFGGRVAARMEVGCASTGEVRGGYSNRSWHGQATLWQPLPEPPSLSERGERG